MKTGEVKVTSKKVNGYLMVRSGTPIEIWNRMPVDKRVYIVSQTEALMKNSKGCWMFSNLERKMIYQYNFLCKTYIPYIEVKLQS